MPLGMEETMLDMSKVLLFIKSVDPLDREKVSLLLQMDGGLTADWTVVKGICSHFDKWREWNNEGVTSANPIAAKKLGELILE